MLINTTDSGVFALPGTRTGMESQTMATTPATASGGDDVVLAVDGGLEHTDIARGEARLRDSSEQGERPESSADAKVVRKLKRLNNIVFCVAFLEWAGNAVGTLAFLWATVVLLGGFSSLLSRTDFWFSTIMIFMEASRCVPVTELLKSCFSYWYRINDYT